MIRRFNYTGRRRIRRSRVRVRLGDEGARRRFDAEIDLDGTELPRDAKVFVEAYHRTAYRRFPFGTVGDPRPPANRSLEGLPVQRPLFRVKVVAAGDGLARILAAADRIVPVEARRDEETRQSLLPVEYEDLGERVWALDLDSDWPRLRLNRRFEGIREAARSGREFLTLVYPEVFRAILERALAEGCFDPEADEDDWGTLWLRFACRELGRPAPPVHGGAEAAEWIDEAVNAFCARARVAPSFEQILAGRPE